MELRLVKPNELDQAMAIINDAKQHLADQGVDQWQTGYPDEGHIKADIDKKAAYFVTDGIDLLGYVCADFSGEPAYEKLQGTWQTSDQYVVIHRLAFSEKARGRGLSSTVFQLVEKLALASGVTALRVDTDPENYKMQHIIEKNGFSYRGRIWFDGGEKVAYDKVLTA
ncbi:GNAT family N-acetyltransferase [Lactobacillus corticis]|uniref:GNAT family acetyltransferase n=1 Tax=Lactobacillus corticis TaxID=2201249 RepID=A0A916QH07_9LACO|nr:GNAT family N-acetyltransferase [Lactobacillus corticis]GFZ27139.1 GNAT family acetyltransferase [Lactobacillus corticis]